MSRWIKNLISYNSMKDAGKCPYCSSKDVDVIEHEGERKSITFNCKKCGKSEHFDGTMN